MNYKQNKEILLALLRATTQEEVTHLIETHEFFKNCQWCFYGGKPNNAGFIKAQTPDPIGALVEKITNGIDAVLIKKCWNNNIDPTSKRAPNNMKEAIKIFFGEDIMNLEISAKKIREIANKTVRIIAEGATERPTISIIDWGEGQHPKDFPKTFLSLGESNKIKIQFAHGIYNQGGSAALKFCGNGYQLILSRRAPEINDKEPDYWGFTLVRERFEPGFRAEWYEYCAIETPDGIGVPYFPYEPLKILPDEEVFEKGSYVRLYSYAMKNPNFFITGQREGELAREINKKYFAMPLPILLQEQRTQLPRWEKGKNDKTRIYGFWKLIKKQIKNQKVVRKFLSLKSELGIFELRNIEIIVINDESKEGNSYKRQSEKVFLTVNGQVQHLETLSFLKTKCLLPDLAPYLIIHINLSDAGHLANKLFNTARTTLIDLPEEQIFRQRLINSIKGDETLKGLNEEYKSRKLEHAQPEDKDLSRYIGRLIKDNPFLASLLKIGEEVPTEKPEEGPKKEYVGKYIPTIFEIKGEDTKEIPHNRYALLRIKTDAVNNYLIREKDKGELKWTPVPIVQLNQYSLREGIIPLRIDPKKDVKPGDSASITFELTRPGQESLKAELKTNIGEYQEPRVSPSGKPREPTTLALRLPKREYVPRPDWPKFDWTGEDIAKVEEDQENITVYINKEPDVLIEFPKRNPRFAAGDVMISIRKRYFASIYLYAIAMFFEMKDRPEEREWIIPMALKAISKFVLDLAFTQRVAENLEE